MKESQLADNALDRTAIFKAAWSLETEPDR
jgi:hypothetical protein